MNRFVLLTMLLHATLFADAKAIYDKHCASCHQLFVEPDLLLSNFMEHNNTLLKLKAPSVNQLRFRLKQMIGDPKGDAEFHRMEVTSFIQEYVMTPNRENSVCLPQVMQHFKTMESLEGKISEEDLAEVSEWIYEEEE
jgi:hypothetical protein